MKMLFRLLLSSLAAAILSVPLAGMAFAHTMSTNGCSSGTVCMYTDSGYSSGSPEQHWYQYGCVNLSNEYGDRYIFNNQYNGASVTLYTGSNCNSPQTTIAAGTTWEGNITPINSISLNP
ncbi:hypothetical protein EPA93_31140 [Ktedonosporobacter rubrisoli]|uniref:Peptidase inhibitor family I36 n=1 Tax=Ktedonosporobacter rubrisoli TaxID=2509675 RepID=A0A4P6JXE1_KTERU|nr:hypothetical protein [Ktedonosporobacter rubrisoli]QBD80195.1 hypothetical protein EPA93_31140 [Ktedonosporobacter rubrisoli]